MLIYKQRPIGEFTCSNYHIENWGEWDICNILEVSNSPLLRTALSAIWYKTLESCGRNSTALQPVELKIPLIISWHQSLVSDLEWFYLACETISNNRCQIITGKQKKTMKLNTDKA